MNEATAVSEKKPRAKASSQCTIKVRNIINAEPKTLASIKAAVPELTAQQISMSLCYLLRRNVIQRESVERTSGFGRSKIWAYTLNNTPRA